MCVLLLKGPTHLPYMLYLVLVHFDLPYHICFALPLPIYVLP
jgi:hypothetical protein